MAEEIRPRFYGCYNCHNHIALHDDIVRKDFVAGNRRRAFLFSHVMNVKLGTSMDRRLITGVHLVADVHCSDCGTILGWRYEKAYDEAQKYKESKTVLEKYKIVKDNW
uniref:protein yippee-like At4g27745 n=1 Tax=Erigeron canadensis TaxID=72917 RepID=UPI001CB90687|nr:protein yippee-like At4g27745 [Erigeron canadensis]